MDFSNTEEQQMLQESVQKFVYKSYKGILNLESFWGNQLKETRCMSQTAS